MRPVGPVLLASFLLAACASAPEHTNSTWYWIGSVISLSPMQPAKPEFYTLQFSDDRAAIRADCNRGTGKVSLKGDSVGFGPMAMTRAFCPPPSLGDAYARQLHAAEQLSVVNGVLRIALKDDDAMFFTEDPEARLALYRCREQKMLSVLYVGDTAQVWYDRAHYALQRERSASGARYTDGQATFHTKGVLGSLRKGDAFLAQNCQLPSR